MRPVTTCRTEYVDQGCWVNQVSYVQAPARRTGLTWLPPTQTVSPVTGRVQYRRPALGWGVYRPVAQPVVMVGANGALIDLLVSYRHENERCAVKVVSYILEPSEEAQTPATASRDASAAPVVRLP